MAVSSWPRAAGRERLAGDGGGGSGYAGVGGAWRQGRGGKAGEAGSVRLGRGGGVAAPRPMRQGRCGRVGAAGQGAKGRVGGTRLAEPGQRGGGSSVEAGWRRGGDGRAAATRWYRRGRGMTPGCHRTRRRLFRWSPGREQSSPIDRLSSLSIGCRHGHQCGQVNRQTRRARASPVVWRMSAGCLPSVWGLLVTGRTFDSTGYAQP